MPEQGESLSGQTFRQFNEFAPGRDLLGYPHTTTDAEYRRAQNRNWLSGWWLPGLVVGLAYIGWQTWRGW